MRVFLFTDSGNSSCFCVIHQCIWRFCCDAADAGHVQKVRVHTSANARFSSFCKVPLTVDPFAVMLISVQDFKSSQWCCWGCRSSGMWHCIVGWVVASASKEQQTSFSWTVWPQRWRHCSPSKLRGLFTSLKTWLHEFIGASSQMYRMKHIKCPVIKCNFEIALKAGITVLSFELCLWENHVKLWSTKFI